METAQPCCNPITLVIVPFIGFRLRGIRIRARAPMLSLNVFPKALEQFRHSFLGRLIAR
ncbi:MAG: hypothetical protein ABSE79_15725 [Terriglobia bacterium]